MPELPLSSREGSGHHLWLSCTHHTIAGCPVLMPGSIRGLPCSGFLHACRGGDLLREREKRGRNYPPGWTWKNRKVTFSPFNVE